MKNIFTSEFLPMLHSHFNLIGRELEKIFDSRRIIILLFAYTNLLSAQSIGWSTPLNISNTISSSNSPAIAINKNNQIYVVWSEYNT